MEPRARRRHDRWRMVRRAWRLLRMWDATKNTERDDRELSVGRRRHDPERLADNLRPCSCLMCSGHKRRVAGPTLREVRHKAGELVE